MISIFCLSAAPSIAWRAKVIIIIIINFFWLPFWLLFKNTHYSHSSWIYVLPCDMPLVLKSTETFQWIFKFAPGPQPLALSPPLIPRPCTNTNWLILQLSYIQDYYKYYFLMVRDHKNESSSWPLISSSRLFRPKRKWFPVMSPSHHPSLGRLMNSITSSGSCETVNSQSLPHLSTQWSKTGR